MRSRSILSALRQSGGTAVAVTDEEILAAQEKLAHRGLFVEPTSATVAAAFSRMRDLFSPDEQIVAVLTGLGLKKLPEFV